MQTSFGGNQIDKEDTGLIAVASKGRRHSGAHIKRQSFMIQTQQHISGLSSQRQSGSCVDRLEFSK